MLLLLLACASTISTDPVCVDVVYVDVVGSFDGGTYSETPCYREAEYDLINYSDCCPVDFTPQGWSENLLVCVWYGGAE